MSHDKPCKGEAKLGGIGRIFKGEFLVNLPCFLLDLAFVFLV